MKDPVPEPDMVNQQQDDPEDVVDSLDMEETLPYMLGDDPELLEDDKQFDILTFDSQVPVPWTLRNRIWVTSKIAETSNPLPSLI